MCYPRAPPAPCQEVDISNTRWSQGIFSPSQMWKALRQLTLKKTSHIRSVTGNASQKVRRVRKWVFNFTFSKIVIPILVLGFLLVLNPYKDIQVGVAGGFLVFFFLFCLYTREDKVLIENTKHRLNTKTNILDSPDVIFPTPSLALQLYSQCPLSQASRLWGVITSKELPFPLNILSVWLFAVITGCRRDEAEHSTLSSYKTVGQFFTRRLKPGLRPISTKSELVSPCDGTVTYSGLVDGPYLQQVKGVHYSLKEFLGSLESINGHPEVVETKKAEKYYLNKEQISDIDENEETSYKQLSSPAMTPNERLLTVSSPPTCLYQTVVYLSPSDYHRFHSPANWTVHKRRYFPGKLFSVKPDIVKRIPGLFHINERVVFFGRWKHGFFAMVAVGATNVGSIKVHFDEELATNTSVISSSTERIYKKPIDFKKGDEFGYFNFGSTLVLIYEAPTDTNINTEYPMTIKVGEEMWL